MDAQGPVKVPAGEPPSASAMAFTDSLKRWNAALQRSTSVKVARISIPAVFFYAALAVWITADNAGTRAFLIVVLATWTAVDAIARYGRNWWTLAAIAAWIIICIAASSVVRSWWQFVIICGLFLHVAHIRTPAGCCIRCCCRCCCWAGRRCRSLRQSPPLQSVPPAATTAVAERVAASLALSSVVTAADGAVSGPAQPMGTAAGSTAVDVAGADKQQPQPRADGPAAPVTPVGKLLTILRPIATGELGPGTAPRPLSVKIILAGLEFSCMLLLLPAITAQTSKWKCLTPDMLSVSQWAFKYNYYAQNRGWRTLLCENGMAGTVPCVGSGKTWQPVDPNLTLYRYPEDDMATYGIWDATTNAVSFTGTHTLQMTAADLDVAPRRLKYTDAIPLAPVTYPTGPDGSSVPSGPDTAPACGDVTVHRGVWRVYEVIRTNVTRAVRTMLAADPNRAVLIGGMSLGGTSCVLAAMDLACSGVASPSQIRMFSIAGFGAGDISYVQVIERLNGLGMKQHRVVNAFDIVPWLPPLLHEHIRTSDTYLSFTTSGTSVFGAHRTEGYIPGPLADQKADTSREDKCAQVRAWAFVPVIIATAAYLAVAGADLWWRGRKARNPVAVTVTVADAVPAG